MGRIADPKLAKVFAKADRGTSLLDAWRALGEPTSWGHVQRAYKAHRETMAAQPAATSGAGRTPASGADRTLSGAARTPAAAAAATAAPSTRVGKSVAIATRLTPQAAHLAVHGAGAPRVTVLGVFGLSRRSLWLWASP